MARKKPESEKSELTGDNKRKRDLLVRVRHRYQAMVDGDRHNREAALKDIEFVNIPGAQWDEDTKKKRRKRPCYEFDELGVTIKRIVNDIRANRPRGKVLPVEEGDKEGAELREGLIRNVWNVNDGDSCVDAAADFQVTGGIGAWKICTDYATDTGFDQEIRVKPVANPLCLYWDPSSKHPQHLDAEDWCFADKFSKDKYEARWPKASRSSFDASEFDSSDLWDEDDGVRVVEYWYKEPATKNLALLPDGRVVDEDKIPPGAVPTRIRAVRTHKIKMCIASGDAILEEQEFASKHFPWVVAHGNFIVINGKPYWYGLVRKSKDSQRIKNVGMTATIESVANAPQAKYWVTTKQAEGHSDKWAEAWHENLPFMLYNPDPQAGGSPQRVGGAEVPDALINLTNMGSDLIKSTSGVFSASIGQQSNETSGRAIRARQAQGEIATFNYADNIAKAIRQSWEIILDLTKLLYTTERTIRILGNDGAEKFVRINGLQLDPETLQMVPVNDLRSGKYDTTVTIGPSFSTQRQEAAETFTQLAQTAPQVWGVAGDIIMENMDLPGADKVAERMKALLPPQIQQQMAQDKPLPPEAMLAMQQADQVMQQAQAAMQQVEELGAEARQDKAAADKAKADVQIATANLKAAQAQFDAQVARAEAQAAKAQGDGAVAQSDEVIASVGQQLSDTVAIVQGLQQVVDAMAGKLMQTEDTLSARMAEPAPTPTVIVPPPPRLKAMRAVRDGQGNLVAIPEYESTEVMQ